MVIHDADLEYFPVDILEMFEVAKENPSSLIVGSRVIGNKKRTNIYLRTKLANRFLSWGRLLALILALRTVVWQ